MERHLFQESAPIRRPRSPMALRPPPNDAKTLYAARWSLTLFHPRAFSRCQTAPT